MGELSVVEMGRMIGERYRIEHPLGNGAMGVVFAARHVALDEMVALKFMRSELMQHGEMRRRFAREAKAAAKIRSDHVASVLDVGTDDELGPYIVMELLQGEDLAQVLSRRGPLPLATACSYVLQACEGLALAHSLGIVHRDLKPSNLFLSHRGDLEIIKLLDFGVSKAALTGMVFGGELSVSDTAHMLGSPLYMSPEQIRATTAVDQRSDVWSLGVVLQELVTGQSPFNAESVADVCARILEGIPAALADSGLCGAEQLEPVIARCLSKEVNERYADVGELAQAIAPFASARARLHSERTQSVLRHHRLDSHNELQESGLYSPIPKRAVVADEFGSGPTQVQVGPSLAPSLAQSGTPMSDPSKTVDSMRFGARRRSVWPWLAAGVLLIGAGSWIKSSVTSGETPASASPSKGNTVNSAASAPLVESSRAPEVTMKRGAPEFGAERGDVAANQKALEPAAPRVTSLQRPAAPAWRPPAIRQTVRQVPSPETRALGLTQAQVLPAEPPEALPEPPKPQPKPRAKLVSERPLRLVE